MAADLHERALRMAVKLAPPDVGVMVVCQVEVLPPPPGKNGRGGPVPLWYLVMTMPNPADLAGQHLRDVRRCGNGAPDFAGLPDIIKAASAELHELARTKLAEGTGQIRRMPPPDRRG